MRKLLFAVGIGLMNFPAIAMAEPTVAQALEMYDKGGMSREIIVAYAQGVNTGYSWYAANSPDDTRQFCEPPKLGMTTEQTFAILKQRAEMNPFDKGFPVGMILLKAMKEVFPCSRK